MGVGGQRNVPASLPQGNTRYPLYRRLDVPEPVWTGTENLASTEIRSPDRPDRSESLYRLHHLSPLITPCSCLKFSVVKCKSSYQIGGMNAMCEGAENCGSRQAQ